ncbi:MAG: type II toxin-antitoxin system RelE family toxin [Candidatus Omnitrophota bacterium]
MAYEILFHPEARKEFERIDGSIKKLVLKQLIKLKENPHLGDKLGNRAGMDLSEFRKMYVYKKKIRIIYRIQEGKMIVFIIAIGDREDMVVYKDAYKRKADKGAIDIQE